MSPIQRTGAIVALATGLGIAIAIWRHRVAEENPPQEPPANAEAALPSNSPSNEEPVPSSSLAARKRELLGMDSAEATGWILRELEKGKDYATGQDLSIGTDQNLTAWPSYRTYLLDMLLLVDPVAAAAKSREIVDTGGSPDEWAVALRNVARADDTGASLEWLREKSAQLLRNETWRSDPSAGYLNAFDVIVHTEHTDLAPELLDLCDDPEQRAVRHASFLVIDRLTQARPDVLLPTLADSASRLRRSGPMISNLIARADLRDDVQRSAVERYLLDPDRREEELASFAGVFPNANFHVSNNLLTRAGGIEGTELAERDRAALAVVEDWIADPRFETIRPVVEMIRSRLARFVEP